MTSQSSYPEVEMRGYRYKHGDRPLEGYTIQRAAGRGGFGEVYAATSDGGREVALKVVHTFEQMELRGIGQCMNLKSPHLVSIFDVRKGEEGQPIVIMEFVSGPSLRELLDGAPSGLGEQKAAFFLREIAKGLSYLHDCGIVHRDLKPANIFYENGFVKIGDYGLSKAISSSHRSGQTMTVGTVHYMAPEIGVGRYDRSIDIYALGVLLFEMLTGHPPFYGASTAEVLMKHLGTAVDVSGLPEPFASVIRKAMAKDPAQRYETAQEIVEAVFGAEHVRQSVSCFSPDQLTMVAGRVANRAGIGAAGRPISSGAYDVPLEQPGFVDRFADRVADRLGRFSRRMGLFGDRIAHRFAGGPAPRYTAMQSIAGFDPMTRGHRFLLAFMSTMAVSVAMGVFFPVSRQFNPPAVTMFTFMVIAGAATGVRWSIRQLLPALHAEDWLLRQLATGGVAVFITMLISTITMNGARHAGPSFSAIAIGLFLIDWTKRTRPDRRQRVSLGSILICAALGLVLSAALGEDGPNPMVIAVLAGTCLAAQILSPWFPGAARRAENPPAAGGEQPIGFQPPSASAARPADANAPAARFNESEFSDTKESSMAVTRVNLGPLKIFSSTPAPVAAPPRDGDERSFFASLIRLPFVLNSFALIFAATLIGFALAFDIPGWMASGRFDPQVQRDMREFFGTAEWPRVLRLMMGAGLFVTAVIGTTFLMLLRRRRGGLHMMRALVGVGLLLAVPFILAERHAPWGIAPLLRSRDWVVALDEFFTRVTRDDMLGAVVAFVLSWLLLVWPAKRRRAASQVDNTSAVSSAQPAHAGSEKEH